MSITPIDVEKVVEAGKAILTGQREAKEAVSELLTPQALSEQVEQVRYAEEQHLSATGQAVLKDLEEILATTAEAKEAFPKETFLHAARAQKAMKDIKMEEGKEGDVSPMDLATLVKMMVTSGEFRDIVNDWYTWMMESLKVKAKEVEKKVPEGETEKVSEGETGKKVSEGAEGEKEPMEEGKVSKESMGEEGVAKEESVKKEAEEEKKETGRFKESTVTPSVTDELMRMLDWLEDKPQYQKAMSFVTDQLRLLTMQEEEEEGEGAAGGVKSPVKVAMNEMKLAALDALKAIESWTGEDFTSLTDASTQFYQHMQDDQELINSMGALGQFLHQCFVEEGFLNDRAWIRDEARDRINNLKVAIDDGGHRERFEVLQEQLKRVLEAMTNEPKTTKLKDSLRKLLEDLFYQEEAGEGAESIRPLRLKTELIGDLGVIFGDLAQKVRFLRIPAVEVHDEDLDFSAHNIILDAKELLPQQFKLTLVTENMAERKENEPKTAKTGLSEEEKVAVFEGRQEATTIESAEASSANVFPNDWVTHLKFECKGIRGHCRNVHFHMRKKAGFPQINDEGEADFRVWGRDGMLVKVVLRPEWVTELAQTIITETKVVKTQAAGLKDLTSSEPSTSIPTQTVHSPSIVTAPSVSTTPAKRKLKLSVVKARCSIDELDLELHGTRHNWFYTMFAPIVRKRVKTAMEEAIERNLLSLMD